MTFSEAYQLHQLLMDHIDYLEQTNRIDREEAVKLQERAIIANGIVYKAIEDAETIKES